MSKNKYKPAYIIPFKLHNIEDFIDEDHPQFHPLYEMEERQEYWSDRAQDCLNGRWGHDYDQETDQGGYRWMPGNLYFYVNMTQIKIEEDESVEAFSKPLLRDIEWYVFYALTECDGFSGFVDDEEYTCYLPLGKLQGKVKDKDGKKYKELLHKEQIRLERYDKYLRKPNGEYKEYITPKEYLYRTFDRPMGRSLYLNEKKNLIILSTRGAGKSYISANGVIQYDFTFGSARTLEDLIEDPKPATVVVGSYDSKKSSDLLNKFETSYEFTRKSIGSYVFEDSKLEDENSPFYQPYDGSLAVGKSITNRVKEEGGRTFTGTGSQVVHVTYRNNISAGVGYRAKRMIIEEAGLLANFLDVHRENTGSQGRETKTGYTIYIGTGGDMEKIRGIREAFYNPRDFDCVEFDDVFSHKPGSIGLFIPSYYRSLDYKDKNGNTDVEKAFSDEMKIRDQKRASGSKSYEGHIISFPIVPAEMFLNSSGNLFPTDLLEDRLTDLETGLWKKIAQPGELIYVNKENTKVRFLPKTLSECVVIDRWGREKGLTEQEMKGTIIFYEHPTSGSPQLDHYKYRYIVTYDSVRDEDGGTSLASVQVWKFWDFENRDKVQFNLVAEWLGRHYGERGLEKDHEVAFKLACYYRCPIFPEINIKDVIRYGNMTKRYYYFLPRPGLAIDGMEVKQTKDYKVGLYISPGMVPDLERYLNEALHTVVDVEHFIHGNKEDYKEIKMVSQIPSMRLIEELLYYSRGENFDAVSSAFLFGVLKRQREEQPAQESEDFNEYDDEFLNFMQGGDNPSTYDNPAFSY